MKFGSVCSGIEAASVAWEQLGWKAAWFSEIEPFPSAVLKHHYPQVPNLGDMAALPARILSTEIEAPEIFCGGTPCQAFSVAGLRKSLDDARGNLSLTFCEIANAIDDVRRAQGEQPAIIFWENVPGVLSTKDNAFGCFLAGLAGESLSLLPPGGRWTDAGCVLGPQRAVAWRVLDAQYFGLAQRRRRVFVVASARDGFDPAAVLFEFGGVRRDSAPSRETWQRVANSLVERPDRGGGNSEGQRLIAQPYAVGNTLTARMHKGINTTLDEGQTPVLAPTLTASNDPSRSPQSSEVTAQVAAVAQATAVAFQPGNLARGAGSPPSGEVFPTLKSDHGRGLSDQQPHVAVAFRDTADCLTSAYGTKWNGNASADNGSLFAAQAMQVRRLTPVECERLQGFPDGYTAIPWRNKPASECPDGPRYKALGNSWAVPVVRWIGKRIHERLRFPHLDAIVAAPPQEAAWPSSSEAIPTGLTSPSTACASERV